MLDLSELAKLKRDNFILLESLPLASNPGKSRTLILIKPNSNEGHQVFTVGRDEKNDIVILDKTISREHSIITYKPDQGFFLSDQYSKFGTCV